MSLGLDQLSDDQLFTLVQELCAELIHREPLVRQAAQKEIDQAARHRQELEFELKRVTREVYDEYRRNLYMEIKEYVRAEVAKGTFRPISTEEEAAMIVDAEKSVRLTLSQGVSPEWIYHNAQTMWAAMGVDEKRSKQRFSRKKTKETPHEIGAGLYAGSVRR